MSRTRWLEAGFVTLGVGLAVNSLLGPFVADRVEYPLSETLLNQTIGLDAFSLIVVAPACLLVAWLLAREHPVGVPLGVGVSGYATYMLVQYIVGPAYLQYAPIVALQLPLFVVGAVTGLAVWGAGDASMLPVLPPAAARRRALVMLGVAAFVVLRYVPAMVGFVTSEPLPEEASADPTMHWLIVWLDLGLVVPATVATAAGLRRGAPWSAQALYSVVSWFVLVPPSVAAMALVMVANDDPYASAGGSAVFVAATVAFAAVAVWVFRPLLRTPRATAA